MYTIIDGKQTSQQIKDELKGRVQQLHNQGIKIRLAVVQVGNNPASSTYIKNKEKACEYIGINTTTYNLSEDTTETELIELINKLNNTPFVNGILVQLPLPHHINETNIINSISPLKDVDCFHPENVGRLSTGNPRFLPCTPAGVIELLKATKIQLEGKECVILGRSNIVGKPLYNLLLQENATVTICHSKTINLKEVTQRADILISAIGKPKFITHEYIKEGAVVIDVGINRDENNKLCGDVDFEDIAPHTSAITPVPGGVGPMTIAMLMSNCLKAGTLQNK